jgi:hypothetical protein
MELRKEHKRPTGTEGRSKPPRRGSLWLASTRKPVIAQPPHVAELGAIAGDISAAKPEAPDTKLERASGGLA